MTKILSGLFIFFLFGNTAQATTESSAGFNLNYLTGANVAGAKLTNPGYGLEFQTGPTGGEWLRPDYGATIERVEGNPGSLTAGSLLGGGTLAHRVGSRLTPFVGLNAILGWGNYSGSAISNNGLFYGGEITAGAEINIKNSSSNRLAIVLKTGYRLVAASISQLNSTALNAVVLGIGLAWTDGGSGPAMDMDVEY